MKHPYKFSSDKKGFLKKNNIPVLSLPHISQTNNNTKDRITYTNGLPRFK
jgi:hypothetical protein